MPRRETCVQAPPAISRGLVAAASARCVEQPALAQAGRGPAADHRVVAAASRQLVVHLERERGDVLVVRSLVRRRR